MLGSFSRFLNNASDVENIFYEGSLFFLQVKRCKVVLAGSKCIQTYGIASIAKFCYTVQKLNHLYILGSFQKLQ
jgi:hypothetical protein